MQYTFTSLTSHDSLFKTWKRVKENDGKHFKQTQFNPWLRIPTEPKFVLCGRLGLGGFVQNSYLWFFAYVGLAIN